MLSVSDYVHTKVMITFTINIEMRERGCNFIKLNELIVGLNGGICPEFFKSILDFFELKCGMLS